MSKAGELFICACCREEHEVNEASFDDQCNGPVCESCRTSFIKGLAWLKHEGIDRPVDTGDVNQTNHNRLRHLM